MAMTTIVITFSSKVLGVRGWWRGCCFKRDSSAFQSCDGGKGEKIRVRVSFWKMVTCQALIGQFGEGRIMTRVIMWLDTFRR